MIPIAVVVKERVFLYNIGCALLWVSTTCSVFTLYLPKFYYIGKLSPDDIKLYAKQSKPSTRGSEGSSQATGPQEDRDATTNCIQADHPDETIEQPKF